MAEVIVHVMKKDVLPQIAEAVAAVPEWMKTKIVAVVAAGGAAIRVKMMKKDADGLATLKDIPKHPGWDGNNAVAEEAVHEWMRMKMMIAGVEAGGGPATPAKMMRTKDVAGSVIPKAILKHPGWDGNIAVAEEAVHAMTMTKMMIADAVVAEDPAVLAMMKTKDVAGSVIPKGILKHQDWDGNIAVAEEAVHAAMMMRMMIADAVVAEGPAVPARRMMRRKDVAGLVTPKVIQKQQEKDGVVAAGAAQVAEAAVAADPEEEEDREVG